MYKTSTPEKIYPSGVDIVAMQRFEWSTGPQKTCWGEEQANKRRTLTNTNRMAVMHDLFPRPRIACGAANVVILALRVEPKREFAGWMIPFSLGSSKQTSVHKHSARPPGFGFLSRL